MIPDRVCVADARNKQVSIIAVSYTHLDVYKRQLVYLLFCTSRYGWGWKNFVAEADEGKGIRFPKWARV